MSKTLGQINYERFTPEWVTPLVPWHEVPVQEQRRWEAAAQAVIKRADEDRFQLRLETEHARTAVIEAARRLPRVLEAYQRGWPIDRHDVEILGSFKSALEALDAAEKGGK